MKWILSISVAFNIILMGLVFFLLNQLMNFSGVEFFVQDGYPGISIPFGR